jgi:hypothetical protein
MGKYGMVAVRATTLVRSGRHGSAPEAWSVAARETFPGSVAAQRKGCPRAAFLGLCEEGLVAGVPVGSYTQSKENKAYALAAVRLLEMDPALASDGPTALWRKVQKGEERTPNHQMDVVLSLWSDGLINRR